MSRKRGSQLTEQAFLHIARTRAAELERDAATRSQVSRALAARRAARLERRAERLTRQAERARARARRACPACGIPAPSSGH